MNHGTLFKAVFAFLLITIVISCKKDKYTIENKAVTGALTYTQTGAVPLEIDPITQQPLKMQFSFSGSGNVSDFGDLTLVSSFVFDFVAGQGYDFQTTYTGSKPSDTFSSTGTSVMIGNMEFTITENFTDGTGKFDKIDGGGEIHVELVPDGSSGTGQISWTATY